MADPFARVDEGDSYLLGGRTFNAFAELASRFQMQKLGNNSDLSAVDEPGNFALVRNNSGANLKRYNVLGLGAPIIDPTVDLDEFKRQPTFVGALPASAHRGKFCIALENIPSGEIGPAMIAGVVPAYVNVTSTNHGFADVDVGEAGNLASGHGGAFQILTAITATGLQWVYGRLGGGPTEGVILKAVTDAEITVGSSGTVSIWREGADTGDNETAHFDWCDAGGSAIASGTEVTIKYWPDEDKWNIHTSGCEANP